MKASKLQTSLSVDWNLYEATEFSNVYIQPSGVVRERCVLDLTLTVLVTTIDALRHFETG